MIAWHTLICFETSALFIYGVDTLIIVLKQMTFIKSLRMEPKQMFLLLNENFIVKFEML